MRGVVVMMFVTVVVVRRGGGGRAAWLAGLLLSLVLMAATGPGQALAGGGPAKTRVLVTDLAGIGRLILGVFWVWVRALVQGQRWVLPARRMSDGGWRVGGRESARRASGGCHREIGHLLEVTRGRSQLRDARAERVMERVLFEK